MSDKDVNYKIRITSDGNLHIYEQRDWEKADHDPDSLIDATFRSKLDAYVVAESLRAALTVDDPAIWTYELLSAIRCILKAKRG